MLSLKAIMGHVRNEPTIPFPGWPAIVAHIFYLQSLLHFPKSTASSGRSVTKFSSISC